MTILPQLERDLFNAAEEHPPPKATVPPEQTTSLPPSSRARLRRIAAGVPLILSVAVAIAVAIVAIVVLRHGHQASPTTSPTGPSGDSTRAELIRTFGILRRPQTKADLDHKLLGLYLEPRPRPGTIPPERYIPLPGRASVLKRWGYPELDRQLVRVVKIPAWAAKVLIAPTRFQPSPSSPQQSEGLNLALWIGTSPTIPPSSLSGTGPRPTSVGTVLAHGLALADPVQGTDLMDGVIAVPDGVGSLTLGPFASLPHETLPGVSTKALSAALAAIHASATVNDNVGTFQLAIPVVTGHRPRGFALIGIGTKAQTTWFNPHGQAIKRTTTEVDLIVRAELKRAG